MTPKRLRDVQRRAHLIAAIIVLADIRRSTTTR
jgi:hypothetical protein